MSGIQDELQVTKIEVEEDDSEIDLKDISKEDYIILAIFWLLAFVVFLQFFTRYVLNNSLGWTEEIARFMLIALTFTGSIMAARKNSHIAVEFLYRYVPRSLRRVAQFAIDGLATVFFAGMTYLTVQLAGAHIAIDGVHRSAEIGRLLLCGDLFCRNDVLFFAELDQACARRHQPTDRSG